MKKKRIGKIILGTAALALVGAAIYLLVDDYKYGVSRLCDLDDDYDDYEDEDLDFDFDQHCNCEYQREKNKSLQEEKSV